MKTAITSASGKLGATIIKQLIPIIGKDNVVGIARTTEKAKHLGVEIRRGDYNSRAEFDQALQGIDKVLLVSGMDEPQKRIPQHRNVIEAAKSNGVKKIVYTSIVGAEDENAFSPVVQSNRQTEKDIQESGLQWAIGRNGIYIEPDLEYIDTYVRHGEIKNCAGEGLCAYTSREELAFAYAKLLTEENLNNAIYNLVGEAITQHQLAENINTVFGTSLSYNAVSVADYKADRKGELGEFLGTVIAGIYEGIRNGANNVNSDFEKVAQRPHKSTIAMMRQFQEN